MTDTIRLSLVNNKQWLTRTLDGYSEEFSCLYKALTELAVRPGTSKSARRIDIAVIEDITNSTIQGNHDITVHGIEIKISKWDLLNDTKMQEYADYCDYFWLAIPEELTDDAIDYVLDDWGILVYHRNKNGSGELRCFQKPKN